MGVIDSEVWLRGRVHGIPDALMPIAQSLLQAREDVARVASGLSEETLWARPGGAASPGYHLFHMAHALDRLMTYARGESLSDAQGQALAMERSGEVGGDARELVALVEATVERSLRQLRCTPESSLARDRCVGTAGMGSNVLGLLFHAAEHTTRHTGQLITTLKILQGTRKN